MKKKLLTIGFMVIILSFITACMKSQDKIKIYSFTGENEDIIINNGLIIITDSSEKFIGGNLSFKDDVISNIRYYDKKFFFYKDDIKVDILNNYKVVEENIKDVTVSSDLGSISSKDLSLDTNLESVKGTLNFLIEGDFINGKKFKHELPLTVKKAY